MCHVFLFLCLLWKQSQQTLLSSFPSQYVQSWASDQHVGGCLEQITQKVFNKEGWPYTTVAPLNDNMAAILQWNLNLHVYWCHSPEARNTMQLASVKIYQKCPTLQQMRELNRTVSIHSDASHLKSCGWALACDPHSPWAKERKKINSHRKYFHFPGLVSHVLTEWGQSNLIYGDKNFAFSAEHNKLYIEKWLHFISQCPNYGKMMA